MFSDDNGNQAQDEGEQGIPGVTIALLQGGSTINMATTGSDGSYAFPPLPLGDYTLQETNLDGYVSTTDDEVDISLTAPGQLRSVDFGDRKAGSIEGTVFSDDNGNRVQDEEEQGIPGVTITLLQGSSTISTTTTAGDGTYVFDPVWMGEYTLQETNPEGYNSTTEDEVDLSLTTPGEQKIVNFGDQIIRIYLPLVARNHS